MSLAYGVGLLLSGGIGLSLGLIGASGSIVTVPRLRRIFAVAVLAVAAFLLVKNLRPASLRARAAGGERCPGIGSPVPCLRSPSAPRPSGSASSSTSSFRRSTSRSGTTTPTRC